MLLKYYPKPPPVVLPPPKSPSESGWFSRWTALGSMAFPEVDGKHEFNRQVTETQKLYPIGSVINVLGYGRCKVMEYLEMRGLCTKNILHNQYEFIKVERLPIGNIPQPVQILTLCPKQVMGAVNVTPTLPTIS